MRAKSKYTLIVVGIIAVLAFIWFFSKIITYFLIALIVSLIGQSIKKKYQIVKIGKFRINNTFATALAMLTMVGIIVTAISFLFPLISKQISMIASVDVETFNKTYAEPIATLENWLKSISILNPDESIQSYVSEHAMGWLSAMKMQNVFASLLTGTGGLLMGTFAVFFISFFFILQERLFLKILMSLTHVEYQTEVKHIFYKVIDVLSRYFVGLIIDLSIVITLISISMLILGVKNALLIGLLAGMMNIVPYVGPLIGASIAVFLATTGSIEMDFYTYIVPMITKICIALCIINILDAFVIQPFIYSNSVKAHPLEVFTVILASAQIAGIAGMILAIPIYTVIRIIAKEFFVTHTIVNKITKEL